MRFRMLAGFLAIMLCMTTQASSQAGGSQGGALPSTIVGKYLVYNSGDVTTFYIRRLPFGITQALERYEYSKSGKTGAAGLAPYNPRKGTIEIEPLMSAEMVAAFQAKNRVYKTCSGDIFNTPVRLKVEPAYHPTTKAPLANVWNVRQDTYVCEIVNLRHNARDNSCRSSCIRYYKTPDQLLRNMRLYSDKASAIADAKRRSN